MGVVQDMNGQNELDYSLEGIAKTLNRLHVDNLGDFHEGLAWISVRTDGRNCHYGYIDKKGELVISCIYENVKDFSDGLARVSEKDWKFGFIDKKGNTVIPFTLDEHTGSFSEGLASVRPDEFYTGYINKKGEFAIPIMKEQGIGGAFRGGIAAIRESHNDTHFIDSQGNVVIPSKPIRCFGYKDGFYVIRTKDGKYGVMDDKGNYIFQGYSEIKDFSEGLFVFATKMKTEGSYGKPIYGFVDINGREIISPQYDQALTFSDGVAAVEKEKKWGYINKQGKIVIPIQYEEAYNFHDGMAFVKTKENYLVINKQGKIVSFHPNYSYFRGNFSEGLNAVKLNDQWGYVDIYGNSTFNPKSKSKSKTATQDNQMTNNTPLTAPSSFPGGKYALKRFIATTMRYPAKAVEQGRQGTALVSFTVEEDGSLTNIQLMRNVGPYLNQEALRIVSLMPKWQPAIKDGVKIKSTQTVEILFKLH